MIATTIENSKTAWLGEFPSHWHILRIKNLFQEMDSRSETGSEELLSVSHYTGITLKREGLENEDDHLSNAESLVGYKLVAKQDLVINIMLAWNGSLGISSFDGITSPAYCVYKIKGNNNPEYFGYLFTTDLFKAEFRRNSTGIMDSRLRLYSDKFFSICTVVPSRKEQDEIVMNIKAQESKINRFIRKKHRFIQLLKEQRQAVLDKILASTIEGNAKIEGGLEHIKINIPQGWLKSRVKNHSSKISKGATPSTLGKEILENGVIRFLKVENLQREIIKLIPQFFIDEETNLLLERSQLQENDILFVITGATIGDVAIVSDSILPANISQNLCFLRPHNIDVEFFRYSLTATSVKAQILTNSNEAAQPSIAMGKVAILKFLLPPLEEQKIIVQQIKTEIYKIDTAISKAEKEIELIKEYKAAMISEAVMGNINAK